MADNSMDIETTNPQTQENKVTLSANGKKIMIEFLFIIYLLHSNLLYYNLSFFSLL